MQKFSAGDSEDSTAMAFCFVLNILRLAITVISPASASGQGNVVWAMEASNGKGHNSRVRRLKPPEPINTKF
jgi:hypothetical protein